ncbi:MAG: hypothetical protein Q4P12_03680 [Bacteroidales bacterium]|nr:hypothetical protein [Bacteroidales bacterium]
MKKLYFNSLLAAFLLLISAPASAAVKSMTELFGKYKFTATIEVTEAGKAFQDYFAAESEVIITKDEANIYSAQITGFAGAKGSEAIKVNAFSEEKQMFKVNSPSGNNYGVFGNGIYYSDADGKYPFGADGIDPLNFTISEDAQTITVPDFTLVGNCDFQAETCDVLVKYTNVRMELVEAETIDIADITGEWNAKAGAGTFDTNAESTIPTTYVLTLAQNSDAKTYKATFAIEGFEPFTLDATFDGNTLTIPFDGNVVDEAKGYKLVGQYDGTSGNISFIYASETTLTMGSPLVIGTVSTEEVEGETKEKIEFVQWWMNGSAKLPSDIPEYSWAGTYNAVSKGYIDFTNDADILPNEGETVITYYDFINAYYITKLFGFDVYTLNQGGLKLTPSEDNANEAEVSLNSSPYKWIYIKSSEDFSTWYKLTDASGQATSITLTLGDFLVAKGEFGNETTYVCSYQSNTLTSASAPEPASWTGTYTVTADVTKYVEGDYPTTFEMVIDPEGDYGQFITSFITADTYSANYGGIKITKDETDENKMTFASDKIVKTVEAGVRYWKIKDMNGSNSDLTCTRNEDGTYSISSFNLFEMTYNEDWSTNEKCIALYENVKATKTSEVSIESTEADPSLNISVKDGVITLGKETNVIVTDMSGRTLFSGKAQTVSGLESGTVIIRTAEGSIKCFIK